MLKDGLVYQDSRMSAVEEFTQDLCRGNIHNGSGKWKGGPILFRDREFVYSDPSEAHSLIVGDTGSMKTLRFVLPAMFSCAMAGESLVVVDPKGELARKMGDPLKKMGYDIHVVNLRSPKDSMDRWNPLGRVNKSRGSEQTICLNDDLNNIFMVQLNTKDPYWDECALQFATGLCRLMLLQNIPLSIKNLLNWRHGRMLDGTLENLYENLPRESDIYQNLAVYMELEARNTKSCILSTFDQKLRLFMSSPELTDMLSESTFEISELAEKPTAVFLVVPDEKTTYHFLATLFISQCYETLLQIAEKTEGRLPIRVNFILEEFCNMPKLDDLLPMLTASRSRNIRFHLVIQSYEQMMDKYGEHIARTTMDNCGNLIYLHSRDMSFLNYISELAGKNEYGRPLISTGRLQRLKKNETLIFHDRCYPMLVRDIPIISEYPIELGRSVPSAG